MIRNDEHRNLEHNFTNKILLFFVSDMNSGIECAFSKFTNDTELHGAVDTLEERNAIQRYLERWAYVGHSTRPIQSPAPGSGQSQTQILAGQSMD